MLGENLMEGAWFWKAPIGGYYPYPQGKLFIHTFQKVMIPTNYLMYTNNNQCEPIRLEN